MKYELLKDQELVVRGLDGAEYVVYRIRALEDTIYVDAGKVGGFASQDVDINDDSWIFDNAIVLGGSVLNDKSTVRGNAMVQDSYICSARIGDHATVYKSNITKSDVTRDATVRHTVVLQSNIISYAAVSNSHVEQSHIDGDVRVDRSKIDCSIVRGYAEISDSKALLCSIDGDAKIRDCDLDKCTVTGYADVYTTESIANAHLGGNALIRSRSDFLTVCGLGSMQRITSIYRTFIGLEVSCGCFSGTLAEFEAQVNRKHKDNEQFRNEYLTLIRIAELHFNKTSIDDDEAVNAVEEAHEAAPLHNNNRVYGIMGTDGSCSPLTPAEMRGIIKDIHETNRGQNDTADSLAVVDDEHLVDEDANPDNGTVVRLGEEVYEDDSQDDFEDKEDDEYTVAEDEGYEDNNFTEDYDSAPTNLVPVTSGRKYEIVPITDENGNDINLDIYPKVPDHNGGITRSTPNGNNRLRRIRALRDIPKHNIKAGTLGGWIESYDNLSQDGDCWLDGRSIVYGGGSVSGNSIIENTTVHQGATIKGDSQVAYSLINGHAVIDDCTINKTRIQRPSTYKNLTIDSGNIVTSQNEVILVADMNRCDSAGICNPFIQKGPNLDFTSLADMYREINKYITKYGYIDAKDMVIAVGRLKF